MTTIRSQAYAGESVMLSCLAASSCQERRCNLRLVAVPTTFISCLIILIVLFSSLGSGQELADYSRFNLAAGNAVDILVIDASGRRTGFDTNSKERVQDIPQSAYFVDAVHDDITGEPAAEEGHQVQIYQPTEGIYRIILVGRALGTYSLSLNVFSKIGVRKLIEVEGVAAPESASMFDVSVRTTPGASSEVTRITTFAATLADIATSQQLGLIANKGIVNSLSLKLRNAERASEPARSNLLKAFKSEVTALAEKQIKGGAVQILLEDADSLLDQTAR